MTELPPETVSEKSPVFYFLNTDSVTALMMSKSQRKAVLNFSSYKNPGGKFYDGSSAQEESLCHDSFLYNVLISFPQFYRWNNEHKNRALHEDRAIYSPKVIFDNGENICRCDVITCAAPNKGTAQKYQNVSDEENRRVLVNRLKFIKNIAEENSVQTLILGAYGCGVFKQDAKDVCEAIRAVFAKTSIDNIVLPVPGNDKNAEMFRRYFEVKS